MALTITQAEEELAKLDASKRANIMLYGKFNPLTELGHGKLIDVGTHLASIHPNSRLGVFYPLQSIASKKAYGSVGPSDTLTVPQQVDSLSDTAHTLNPAEYRKLGKEVLLGADRLAALEAVVADSRARLGATFPTEVGPRELNLSNLSAMFNNPREDDITFLIAGTDRAGKDGAYNRAVKKGVQYLVVLDRPDGAASSSETRAKIKAAKTPTSQSDSTALSVGLSSGLHHATPAMLTAKTVHTIWQVPEALELGQARRAAEAATRKRKGTTKTKTKKKKPATQGAQGATPPNGGGGARKKHRKRRTRMRRSTHARKQKRRRTRHNTRRY